MLLIIPLFIAQFIYIVSATYYGPILCDTVGCRGLPSISSGRSCMCLSDVSTYEIYCSPSSSCGTARVFASTDCTGAYDTVGSTTIKPAYWVNSMSFGSSSVSSSMYGTCATFNGYLG
jgi:hypothetical protein